MTAIETMIGPMMRPIPAYGAFSTGYPLDDADDAVAWKFCARLRRMLLALTSAQAASPLFLLRQTMTTFPPRLARPIAVSFPTPELPPVTMHILPSMRSNVGFSR